jgi:DNA-binding NarL/FixJ family response regulator
MNKELGAIPAKDAAVASVVVVDGRTLVRECLLRCLVSALDCPVVAFPSVDSWIEASKSIAASIVLLSTASKLKDPNADRETDRLLRACAGVPVILVSDSEVPADVADALQKGTRGYIPTNVSLDVAIEAMRLVRAGGTFVPASSFIAANKSGEGFDVDKPRMFTARQAAVVEALRRGKANKIIAYELNMRESTVKVHVRNIMKKLRARNRTEIAFMMSKLMELDRSECLEKPSNMAAAA